MARAWYVGATHHRQELIAEEYIRQRPQLRGVQVFNPKCRITKVVNGRRQTTERPYISNYIFLHFDVLDDGWRQLHAAKGIKRIISSSAECPTRIRGDALQKIISMCGDGEFLDEVEADRVLAKFIPLGSTVKVMEGPFAGFSGPVDKVAQQRIEVLLNIFGRETTVKTTTGAVELVL